SLDRRGESRATGIGLQLVDPPDEAGAVEAAVGPDVERGFLLLAQAAPDVGKADEADGRVQHACLPGAELGQLEGGGRVLDELRLPALEAQDLGYGVGGLGAGDRVGGKKLEVVVSGGMVRAQPEQPRDGLGAEAR